jgi:DNA polymerase III delta' subunit
VVRYTLILLGIHSAVLGCAVGMPGLDSIQGQTRAIAVLRAAIADGRVHHAYLFEGPVGSGKATCARALALALNCERAAATPDGCGSCDACLKIDSGSHPDVIWFDMTPKGLTERVRELIVACGFRPHEGRARVVILDPADDLAGAQEGRTEAANVLLKTLEEPPAGTYFVLVTAEPRRLPVTVLSRCQRLRFMPLDEQLAAQLRGEGEDAPLREQVQSLVLAARKAEPRAMFDAASEFGGDKEQALAVCAFLWKTLRDALLLREQLHRGRVPPARADFAAQILGDHPSASLLASLRATSETALALKGNVAPPLALEHLMLQLSTARST